MAFKIVVLPAASIRRGLSFVVEAEAKAEAEVPLPLPALTKACSVALAAANTKLFKLPRRLPPEVVVVGSAAA